MFGSICPCGVEGFTSLDKREIFVLSDSACIYEHAGHRAIQGMSFDEAKAFFYDMHDVEDKGKAKPL